MILEGWKTYLTALAAVLIALGFAIQNYYSGLPVDITVLIDALIALALIFLRKGISESTKKE